MRKTLNKREQLLLRAEVGDAEPRLTVRSSTKIDGGRWWRRTPTWICVMAEELVMLGVARRRFFERVPIADCAETYYHHATGELVIPNESLELSRFAVTPGEAIRILNFLNIKP